MDGVTDKRDVAADRMLLGATLAVLSDPGVAEELGVDITPTVKGCASAALDYLACAEAAEQRIAELQDVLKLALRALMPTATTKLRVEAKRAIRRALVWDEAHDHA